MKPSISIITPITPAIPPIFYLSSSGLSSFSFGLSPVSLCPSFVSSIKAPLAINS